MKTLFQAATEGRLVAVCRTALYSSISSAEGCKNFDSFWHQGEESDARSGAVAVVQYLCE